MKLPETKYEKVSLDDACELITDGTHQTPTYADEGITFLSAKNVTSGSIDWKNVKYVPESLHEEYKKRLVPKVGDLLLAKNGTTGVGAIIDRDDIEFSIYVSLALLRPSSIIEPDYLLRAVSFPSTTRQFNGSLKGIGVPNLHLKEIRRTEIPLPPLEEQKRIAGILDAADILRVKRREALAKLDDLLQSTFLDMFGDPVTNPKGWDVSELGEICLEKPAYGSGEAACDYNPSMPRYIRITDVDETGELSKDRKSAMMDEKEIEKYRLSDGDLLLARSGATVGKSYLHRARNGLCVYAGYMIRFRPDPTKLLPETLFRFTQTKAYWRWIESQARAVAQPNINAKMYSSMPVLLAPLELQQRFAEIVSTVEEQKAKMRAHLEQLDDLFASLQQRAFRGDL